MKGKKLIIAIISIVVVLAILFSVIAVNMNAAATAKLFTSTGVKSTQIDYDKDFAEDTTSSKYMTNKNNAGKDYVKKAESEYLELYLKQDGYKVYDTSLGMLDSGKSRYDVAVYDKRTKKLWTGIADDSKIDYENLSDTLTSSMQSLVAFNYYDVNKGNDKQFETNSMLIDSEISDENIPNGFKLTYNIRSLSIKFDIEFKIYKDQFDVVIPKDQIVENLQNRDKIQKSRAEIKTKIDAFQGIINKIKSGISSLDENERRLVTIRLDSLSRGLLSLNGQNVSGGGASDLINEILDTTESVGNSLKDNPTYKNDIDQMYKLMDDISKALILLSDSALCGLVSMDVMPYFGTESSKGDGYVFYPDGSGSISYFDTYHPEMIGSLDKDIYSNHITDIGTYFQYAGDEEDQTEHEEATSVRMPVFGMKRGNSAFVSIVAEGDTDAAVSYTPANKEINLNTINIMFYMRHVTQNTTASNSSVKVIDEKIISQNRRLRYVFLDKDQADYSGMAIKYREHLESHGLITQSKYMENDKLPLFMAFFMGQKVSGATATPEFQELTTYKQAEDILKDLSSKGVGQINSSLMGWSATGGSEMPDYKLKPEKKLGGISALESLTKYSKDKGYALALENQYIFSHIDDMTYLDKDVATTKNYGNFTIEFYGFHMFNPTVTFNRLKDSLSLFKKYGTSAATFTNEGTLLYNDYNKHSPYRRALTEDTFKAVGKEAKKELGYVNYRNPNIYMANVADWMMDFPEEDSQFLINDEQVPFYQMVVHGYVPYTGEPQNMMYDLTRQSLKYIEYGYMPYYLVTNDELDSKQNYNDMYATKYSDWSDTIVSKYKEYNENLGNLWKAKIVSHKKISDGVVCVTYDTGDQVVINYNKTEKKYSTTTIPAQGYKVIRR
jgi:hypothetical protein